MTAARDAMTAGLGAAGVTTLDDAGVGDYIEGMLADAEDETDEDLAASIGPLLVDTGVAADDDAAQLLSMEIMRALRGAGGGPAADKTAIRTLNGPVSMMALVNADEQAVTSEAAKARCRDRTQPCALAYALLVSGRASLAPQAARRSSTPPTLVLLPADACAGARSSPGEHQHEHLARWRSQLHD